ncbi:Multi antimicrobial extrusion protein, partial [Corchorus capsularis]
FFLVDLLCTSSEDQYSITNQAKASGRFSLRIGHGSYLYPTISTLNVKDSVSSADKMEATAATPLLNSAAPPVTTSPTTLLDDNGDYAPPRSFRDVKSMFWIETVKTWKIAGPIGFQLICQYGVNSVTNIFVGHIGNVELSAVTIALNVFGTFSFGFLVCS